MQKIGNTPFKRVYELELGDIFKPYGNSPFAIVKKLTHDRVYFRYTYDTNIKSLSRGSKQMVEIDPLQIKDVYVGIGIRPPSTYSNGTPLNIANKPL